MNQRESGTFRRGDPGPRRPLTALGSDAVAGVILILGAGAAYFLTQAGPEALAATSRVLITVGFAGLLLMGVFGVRLLRTDRDAGGGPGGEGHQPPEPFPAPPMDDLDAEFLRIINDERLRDIGATPPEPPAGLSPDVRARLGRSSPC